MNKDILLIICAGLGFSAMKAPQCVECLAGLTRGITDLFYPANRHRDMGVPVIDPVAESSVEDVIRRVLPFLPPKRHGEAATCEFKIMGETDMIKIVIKSNLVFTFIISRQLPEDIQLQVVDKLTTILREYADGNYEQREPVLNSDNGYWAAMKAEEYNQRGLTIRRSLYSLVVSGQGETYFSLTTYHCIYRGQIRLEYPFHGILSKNLPDLIEKIADHVQPTQPDPGQTNAQ